MKVEAWGKLTEVGHVVLFISDVVPMMVVCSEVVMAFASGRLVLDSRETVVLSSWMLMA